MSKLAEFIGDRIQVNSVLLVLCFVAVLALESQSAASYASYLLALAMLVAVRQWTDVFRIKQIWLIAGLLAYLSVSSTWSQPFELREAVSVATRSLLVLLFVVAFAECQLRGQMTLWLARALAVVGMVAVLAAIANFFISQPADGRLNGLGQLDTHVIAALVYGVVLLFVAQVFFMEASLTWKGLALTSGALILLAIYLSDSRNAWVSVLLGLSVLVVAHRVRDPQRFIAGLVVVAFGLSVVLLVLLLNEGSREWLLPRGLSYRPGIWDETLERLLASSVWFGQGISTNDDMQLNGMEFLHPHNMYLSVLLQGGVIGLVGFVALIWWSLVVLMRFYHEPTAKLALGVFGIALPAYLLDGHELVDKVGSTWFLFWLPVAISLGYSWRQRTQGDRG